MAMAQRGRGGGYTRGTSGFRQRGRAVGSPYGPSTWRDKDQRQQGHNSSIKLEPPSGIAATPSRDDSNHSTPPEQSPVGGKIVKKFSNKARLFVANLPRDMTESEFKTLFEPFGEVQEVYIQKEKNFGFCRMAYKSEAERAIAALHGSIVKGRDIKVRFAANSSSVKVDNIHPLVSNELLRDAFSQFGEVEEAVVVTDIRGKSKGFGIVDFARKQSALNAISQCKNAPFLLTKSPIPVVVSEHERDNEDDGQADKSIPKNQAYMSEYEIPPRFAAPGDVEFMIASRWKVVFDEEKAQREELEARIKDNRASVRDQMGNIHEQHKTDLLRQELAHHRAEQMRLMAQLSEREGGMLPPSSRPGGLPPVPPPLFPADRQEGMPPDPGAITIPGLGGLLPPTGGPGGYMPQPLMGQGPGFEQFH